MTDPWKTFGLRPGASPEDIRAAYRRLARAAHPDHPGGSHEAFVELRRQYDELTGERPPSAFRGRYTEEAMANFDRLKNLKVPEAREVDVQCQVCGHRFKYRLRRDDEVEYAQCPACGALHGEGAGSRVLSWLVEYVAMGAQDMSDWDVDFVGSLERQRVRWRMNGTIRITPKQVACLMKIYERIRGTDEPPEMNDVH